MWLRILVVVVLALAAIYAAAFAYGASLWKANTQELRARLDSARSQICPSLLRHEVLVLDDWGLATLTPASSGTYSNCSMIVTSAGPP